MLMGTFEGILASAGEMVGCITATAVIILVPLYLLTVVVFWIAGIRPKRLRSDWWRPWKWE